jgi:hypothetical protein
MAALLEDLKMPLMTTGSAPKALRAGKKTKVKLPKPKKVKVPKVPKVGGGSGKRTGKADTPLSSLMKADL